MLDDFKNTQKVSYKIIKNELENDKISHAYIIESNGYSKSFDFALSVVKYLFCPNHYTNNLKCNNCDQCSIIDKNEFLELNIIDASGMWIKKENIDELQELFSRKPIYGKRKVYIINNAEKLNNSSSNSILKFLEEPSEGIIAILIVENINQLLPTIVSRCQKLSLNGSSIIAEDNTISIIAHILKNKEEDVNLFIDNSSSTVINTINFIKYYEKNKLDTILFINNLWHKNFKEKNDIYDSFSIMILFYKDILNYLIGEKIVVFKDYFDDIKEISSTNKKNIVIKKINVIMELRDLIKQNANINLLMDKLIISLKGCEI